MVSRRAAESKAQLLLDCVMMRNRIELFIMSLLLKKPRHHAQSSNSNTNIQSINTPLRAFSFQDMQTAAAHRIVASITSHTWLSSMEIALSPDHALTHRPVLHISPLTLPLLCYPADYASSRLKRVLHLFG